MQLQAFLPLALLALLPSALSVPLYRNGGASKPYNKVRTPQDYDNPVNNVIPANPKKGMSMNDNKGNLPNQNKNVWMIDSEELTTGRLNPVNDNTSPGHWSITLKIDTNIDTLLDSINNADGWKKLN